MMMRRALQRSSSVGGHYLQHAQRAHLHASRPALAKILCADSIDPVRRNGGGEEGERKGGLVQAPYGRRRAGESKLMMHVSVWKQGKGRMDMRASQARRYVSLFQHSRQEESRRNIGASLRTTWVTLFCPAHRDGGW